MPPMPTVLLFRKAFISARMPLFDAAVFGKLFIGVTSCYLATFKRQEGAASSMRGAGVNVLFTPTARVINTCAV